MGDEGKSAFLFFSLSHLSKNERDLSLLLFYFLMPLLIIKSERKTDERGEENSIAFSLSSSLPSLAQKEFENEHDQFPSYFTRLTPFFRNGNGRENLFFLLSFFLLSEWAREEKNRVRFPLLSIFLPYWKRTGNKEEKKKTCGFLFYSLSSLFFRRKK